MLGFDYCLMVSWLFGSLRFTSSVSLTGFYTKDEPNICFLVNTAVVRLLAISCNTSIKESIKHFVS